MALAATAVFQVDNVNNSPSDALNAGYFNPAQASAGTDFSVSSPLACTDLQITATTTQVQSATLAFNGSHVGNGLRITAGTGFTAGLYEIISVSGGTATLDRAAGTASSTGGTARCGGPLASPGQVGAFLVPGGNIIYLRNTGTAYTQTTTAANVAGGRLNLSGGGGALAAWLVGYNTTRSLSNTDAGRPTIRAGVNGMVAIDCVSSQANVRNIMLDNPSAFTGTYGFQGDLNNILFENCSVNGFSNGFYINNPNITLIDCLAQSCGAVGFTSNSANVTFIGCVALSCSVQGFKTGGSGALHRCAAINTASGIGFILNAMDFVEGCLAYGTTGTGSNGIGFQGQGDGLILVNCLAVNGGTYGFTQGGSPIQGSRMYNCAGYNNTSGNTNTDWTTANNFGFLALSANPFNNAGSLDFGLNNTAGGGSVLRGAGWPAGWPGLSTASYPDVGLAQHQAAAAAAAAFPVVGVAPAFVRGLART